MTQYIQELVRVEIGKVPAEPVPRITPSFCVGHIIQKLESDGRVYLSYTDNKGGKRTGWFNLKRTVENVPYVALPDVLCDQEICYLDLTGLVVFVSAVIQQKGICR